VTELGIIVIWLPWGWIHQCTHWWQLCCVEPVRCCQAEVWASDTLRSVYSIIFMAIAVFLWLCICCLSEL